MWSPYQIEIMLHHYSSTARFERADAPAYGGAVDSLINAGVLEYRDGIPRSTLLGVAFVALICDTPVPQARYIDPRFEALSPSNESMR